MIQRSAAALTARELEPLPSIPDSHARAARSGCRSTTGFGAGRGGAVTPRCERR